jgi:hypothetical protein
MGPPAKQDNAFCFFFWKKKNITLVVEKLINITMGLGGK